MDASSGFVFILCNAFPARLELFLLFSAFTISATTFLSCVALSALLFLLVFLRCSFCVCYCPFTILYFLSYVCSLLLAGPTLRGPVRKYSTNVVRHNSSSWTIF
jgi:hypothetical protein